MLKRARTAGLLPALVISLVLAAAFIAPASANRFSLVVVPGCGYGYPPPPVAPTVTSVSPPSGTWQGGTSVTITGTGFCNVSAVYFGTTPATSFIVNSSTSITAISPAGTPGQVVDVTVTTDKGTSATSAADKFRYTSVPAPPDQQACSRLQYKLTGSDGASWMTMDAANLSIGVTPSVDSFWILTGNADLWTSSAGFNQNLGLTVFGGTSPSFPSVAGQPEAWKESGGFGGTFSPNAAAVQTVLTVKAGQAYGATLQWKAQQPDSGTIWAAAGPAGGKFSQTCIIGELVPVSAATVVTKVSTSQYNLPGSDGATWKDIDATNLSLSFTAPSAGVLLIGGNADLWTANAGFNQDIAINVGGIVSAWKESGGFNGTFSPNAAFVQIVLPVAFDNTYTAKLQWKAQQPDSGTIYAGAGPIAGKYSPTRLTLLFLPTASAAIDKVSTSQYSLPNSDGSTWVVLDWSTFTLTFTPSVNCKVILSANVDLWTANAGFNQDIGISISDTGFPSTAGQPEAWKESGGFNGTYSPNAAYMKYEVHVVAGKSYAAQLVWKANQPAAGTTIYAGAGPIGGKFSPTRLTLQPIGC